jgi:phosphatidylserine/phosphatidylglycerophosphate/cardiolipin synthase-like enzyme
MKKHGFSLSLVISILVFSACGDSGKPDGDRILPPVGKADDFSASRSYEVILTAPHCDVCTAQDKTYLLSESRIIAKVIELVDSATTSVDAAQFTFSRREIEAALLRAHERGVAVRLAMNHGQQYGDNVSNRLKDAGVPVRFIQGNQSGDRFGLMHAKFMMVDDTMLLTGSNNWSSTGTSINNENTVVMQSLPEDPMLIAFACAFDAIWEGDTSGAVQCNTEEAKFTPGSPAQKLIVEEIRAAEHSVDVLMHHLLFDKLLKTLAQAAERGVEVRIVLNAADRDEVSGRHWERLLAGGAKVRYKQTNPDLYQIMHHKLTIVDGEVLINGSGNWSGSAFFSNFEFYVRYPESRVVKPFRDAFDRLWRWSLSAEALDAGKTAAMQEAESTNIFFGNLHAHHFHRSGEKWLDDGQLMREIDGELVSVEDEAGADPLAFAYRYARDVAGMDFLVLSPHVYDDDPADQLNMPNMSTSGYQRMMDTARDVNQESAGSFLAVASMEWNTNSMGNHVNIFGSGELCKIRRGAFDLLYDEFLPMRALMGDNPRLMLNHPRTFRQRADVLTGNWDQIFDVDLRDIPKRGQRTKKFNDYGLDDYPPLKELRESWIEQGVAPDPQVVEESLENVRNASAPYVRLMEVTLNRGSEIKHTLSQNPSIVPDDEGEMFRLTKVHSDWDYYLLHGFELAPAASHDNHYANWGTGHSARTALLAGSLDPQSFLDAIDDRAVYASEDENLEIRFYLDGRIRQGRETKTLSDAVTLGFHLSDPDYAGPYRVVAYLGTVGTDQVQPAVLLDDLSGDQWHQASLTLPGSGRHFVYLEVYEPGHDRMAWTAPVWVDKPEIP